MYYELIKLRRKSSCDIRINKTRSFDGIGMAIPVPWDVAGLAMLPASHKGIQRTKDQQTATILSDSSFPV